MHCFLTLSCTSSCKQRRGGDNYHRLVARAKHAGVTTRLARFVRCTRLPHTAVGLLPSNTLPRSHVRRLTIGLFLLYLLAVTWPLATLFRAPQPQVFGLPLSMAWPIGWILIGWITLLILDHVENKGRDE